jgi:hypothetical protein
MNYMGLPTAKGLVTKNAGKAAGSVTTESLGKLIEPAMKNLKASKPGSFLKQMWKAFKGGPGAKGASFGAKAGMIGAEIAIPLIASYIMSQVYEFNAIDRKAELAGLQQQAESAAKPTVEDEVARAMLSAEQQESQAGHQAVLQQIMQGGVDPGFVEAMNAPAPSSISFRQPIG